MTTVTKKDLIDRIIRKSGGKRVMVRDTIQRFLDEIMLELAKGNRIEFRDFGVFEVRERAARIAQNPRTLQRVFVPPRQSVKFKAGRRMKQRVDGDVHVDPEAPHDVAGNGRARNGDARHP